MQLKQLVSKVFSKETLKAIVFGLILALIGVFAFEFILIAEVVGSEYALTFALLYFKQAFYDLVERWIRFKQEVTASIESLLQLLMFQPKTYGITASASCLFIVITGSTLFACAIWLPAIAMSSGVPG
jgi:hypothetical protein